MKRCETDSRTLFRPVGKQELDLIKERQYVAFPPRLPEQPFFYHVITEEYAVQIARDWNAKYNDPKCGYVNAVSRKSGFHRSLRAKNRERRDPPGVLDSRRGFRRIE